MPLYDYVCPMCEHTEEVLQGADAPAPRCPHSLGTKMIRRMPRPGMVRFRDHSVGAAKSYNSHADGSGRRMPTLG